MKTVLTFFLFIGLGLKAQNPNGLVACYPFTGSTNDASGNGNNGTKYSSTFTTDRFGNPNSAGSFDGLDDSVNVGKNSSLKMTNAVSISAWIFPTTFTPTQNSLNYQNIVSDHAPNETTVGAGKILRLCNNAVQFVVGGVVGQGSGQFVQSSNISLNQWSHLVGTYDGTTIKLYINGVLVSSAAYSQPLVANPNNLLIGKSGYGEYFNGSIDDMEIYNRAITSSEVQTLYNATNICCSTPPVLSVSPTNTTICTGSSATFTVSGAITYTWSPATGLNTTTGATVTATPTVTTTYTISGTSTCGSGSTTLTVTVSNCSQTHSIASFTAPDTVCVNQSFSVTNTSTNASTYYWNFCSGNTNTPSQATNLGNPGGLLQYPVATQIFKDAGNYYMFVANNQPGTPNSLVRLNFGSSLSNTPTAINLGNPNNVLPDGYICDLKIENENGHYYGIAVGGYANGTNGTTTASPRIIRLDFGNSLMNTPTATNLGNLGSWSYPHSLDIFQSGSNYYGFVLDATGNKVSRLDFGNSLSNTPTNTTLPNILNLNGPSRLSIINYQNNWYGYIANSGASGNNTITILNFGNSLVNNPTATRANTSTSLNQPTSISVFPDCGGISGLIGTYPENHLINLNFPNGPTGTIVTSDMGNVANTNNPNSINNGYRVGDTLYVFIPQLYGNSMSRLEYLSCNNSSIPSSTLQTPPSISYNTPGVYDITLTTDETLITESTFCKQVVVIGTPTVTSNSGSICSGSSLTLTASGATSYSWLPASGLNTATGATITATPTATTIYTVTGTNNYCTNSFTSTVTVLPKPTVTATSSSLCSGSSTTLNANGTAAIYKWSPTTNLSSATGASVIANPNNTTTYTVTGTAANGCTAAATSLVTVITSTNIVTVNSTAICIGDSATLIAKGMNTYTWSPATNLSSTNGATVTATPMSTTTYTVTGSSGCANKSAVSLVTVNALPSANLSSGTECKSNIATFQGLNGTAPYYFKYKLNGAAQPQLPTLGSDNTAKLTFQKVSKSFYNLSLDSVKDANGCVAAVSGQTTVVKVVPKPSVVFAVDPQVTDLFKPTVTVTDASVGGNSWVWDYGDGNVSVSNNSVITHTYADTGTYKVKLVVANSVGCKDSSYQNVIIKPPFVLYVPNTFTPDNDGNNDEFSPKADFILKYVMNIYDRWGNHIFYTDDLNKGWDGIVEGGSSIAGVDTYVYVIDVRAMSNKHDYTYRGYFNLLR